MTPSSRTSKARATLPAPPSFGPGRSSVAPQQRAMQRCNASAAPHTTLSGRARSVLTARRMAYEGYDCLKVRVERGVAFVTIDHPPINLFDLPLMQEIDRIGRELEADGAVRVVVFDSADPEFFIAHADVGLIQRLPTTPPPKPTSLGFFHAMVDRFRTMPKATIAKIEGRA